MPPEIRYTKHYLREVIARVDFPSPLENIATRLPKEITEIALEHFPIAEPRKAVAQELQMSPEKVSSKKTEFTEWRFFGKDRDKTLTITPRSLVISYSSYRSYGTLRNEFLSPLTTLLGEFPEVVINRLGLRYINHISIPNGNPLEWQDFLNGSMLGIFDFYPDKQAISRAFHVLEFNFDEFNLKFQYGMHNPDYPASIKKKVFALDLDAYRQGSLTLEEIRQDLDTFHSRIQELFELSITEQLRGIMNG